MTTNQLDTIEMTRQIRDALYEQVKHKSTAERLAFYQEMAQAVHHELGIVVNVPAGEARSAVASPRPN